MSSRSNLIHHAVYLAALAVFCQSATAAEPTQSLAEKRLGIIKGTTPGIVIIDFDKKPATTAPAPASTTATATAGNASSTTATTTATTAVTTAVDPKASSAIVADQPIVNRLFSALPPPSGRSLQSARRLDAPDQGIALPTARAASQPQAEPAKR